MNLDGTTTFDRPRLSHEVAQRLETAILEGRLQPGERMPSERTLSAKLGVSRPVLREALRVAESRGLVVIEHGRGTFVADVAGRLMDVRPDEWLADHLDVVGHFYEARIAVEPVCAALAAERAAPESVAAVVAAVRHGAEALERGQVLSFIGADIDFHRAVAQASGNPMLELMLARIIDPNTDLRRVLHRLPGHPPVAQERHQRILAAIQGRDARRARRTMRDALTGALRDVLRGVGKRGVIG